MPPPLQLPPATYLPDLPDFPAAGSSNIFNVYPRVRIDDNRITYGPVPSPMPQYGPINARCQGGTAVRDSSGNTFIFSGDVADLYLLKAGLDTWQNCSKSPGAYSTPSDGSVQFCYFNGDVITTNFADPLQYFTLLSSSTFADLPGDPPRGRSICVVKNAFVVLGNTYDPVNGNMPQRVWWSGAGNAEAWPDPGSTEAAQLESGAVDLLGSGGWVQGFATDLINADAVVFQEYQLRRMQYTGNPVFSFLPVENAQGTPCPDSIVVRGGIAYYWGQDGVYAFDGGQSVPIGANKVDKFLFGENGQPGNFDRGNAFRVVGAVDPLRKLILWAYPSINVADGNPDRILIYNWLLNEFSLVTDITCETLMGYISIGYTLDQLYTIFGYTVDTIPAPLSSSVWLGGALNMGLFSTSHTLNFLTGTPLEATIETDEMQPVPGRRALVTATKPLVDVNTAGADIAPTVAIGHRETQQQTVTYSQAFPMNSLGVCNGRASGMYVRSKCVIPAGTTTWSNFTGVEISAVAQGTR